jgi:hypothetical protein
MISPSLAEFWNSVMATTTAQIRRFLEHDTAQFGLVFAGQLLPQSDNEREFWNVESSLPSVFQNSNIPKSGCPYVQQAVHNHHNPHHPTYPLDAPRFLIIMEVSVNRAKAFCSIVLLS